jgi:ribosome recycling factor
MAQALDHAKTILTGSERKMQKVVEATTDEFHTLRTGRASIMIVETLKVDYYNQITQLKGLASLTTPDARTIVIQPWDPSSLVAIEKAIQTSDLGLVPNNDGKLIRIQLPSLTDERRTELDKMVRKIAEEGRIAIRNIRHESNDTVKKLEKEGAVGEDVSKTTQKKIQDLTNKYSKSVDDALAKKEREIKEV